MTFTLRDYQERGVSDIRAAFRRGCKRVLYQCPTGAGKTVLFSYMADRASDRGRNVGILVHRRELLLQSSRSLSREHGLIQAGFTPNPDALIQVASVQTLVNRLGRHHFDFMIIDEAHHTPATTYRKILDANPRAFVLGVTATPCRGDGKGLDDLFDEIVLGPTVAELMEAGHLARARVFAPSTIQVDGIHIRRGDYVRSELEDAADTSVITGNAIEHYRKYCHRKPAIAFCVSVAHAKHVAEAFTAAGYRAMSVDGTMKQGPRDRAIASLGNGSLDVLTSCDLISEGIDVPVVECAILLRPTKSLGLFLQQVGRALRPSPHKEYATILDHAGNCVRHRMLPDTPIEWSLQGVVVREKKPGERQIAVRECPQCYAVHSPAPTCPMCGYVYVAAPREIEVIEGELTELTKEEMVFNRKKEQGSAQTYDDLVTLGQTREYKNPWGWARNIIKARGARA